MGKLMALLAAGTGTATVSVGGFYLVKGSGIGNTGGEGAGTNGVENLTPSSTTGSVQTTSSVKKLEFSSLEEFKTNKGYKCSPNTAIFPDDLNLDSTDNVGEFSTIKTSDEDFLGSPANESNKISSCLIINWEKKIYNAEKDKWSGTFTWTWSFANDTKGFIVTNIAKAEETGKLKLTGGAYLLKKNDSSSTWEVKYRKEVKTAKEFDGSAFEDKFPKAKADSGVSIEGETDGDYWGFIKNKDDLSKICGPESCTDAGTQEPERKLKKFVWKHNTSGDKKIAEWSHNLNWWDDMYTKNDFDLSAKLEPFKGTWIKSESVS